MTREIAMTFYDYKVTPAPKQLKRIKGISSTAELFAATLSEAINLAARDGWEYVRAESLPATEARGWFRRGAEVIETVLVFRRPRETLGPRLASARAEPAPAVGIEVEPRVAAVERPATSGQPTVARREPWIAETAEAATPLRGAPRLGPADQL